MDRGIVGVVVEVVEWGTGLVGLVEMEILVDGFGFEGLGLLGKVGIGVEVEEEVKWSVEWGFEEVWS